MHGAAVGRQFYMKVFLFSAKMNVTGRTYSGCTHHAQDRNEGQRDVKLSLQILFAVQPRELHLEIKVRSDNLSRELNEELE